MGQAAVEASIVSPILIIIVSLTAICSFAIPDFSLSFHCRLATFVYIVLGAIAGFLGISAGFAVHLLILCNMKSFGIDYFQTNFTKNSKSGKGLILSSAWERENRPEYLKTKRPKTENEISMKWKYYKQ